MKGLSVIKNIFLLLDPLVQELLRDLFSRGHYVTLIGGGVRDFLLTGQLPNDLDFEMRSDRKFTQEEWFLEIDWFKDFWQGKGIKIGPLPFGILRPQFDGQVIELSSPREEIFFEEGDPNCFSHKNFTAKISPTIPYNQAFSRRDFTVNAMGIEIRGEGKEVFIDPFGGMEDLKSRVLRPCGPNFAKDPVRLLRAIRFHITMGFKFSPVLESKLPLFNLTQLSSHYFFSEGLKSGDFISYAKFFIDLCERLEPPLPHFLHGLKLKEILKGTRSSGENSRLRLKIAKKSDLIAFLIKQKVAQEILVNWSKHLEVSVKYVKRFNDFYTSRIEEFKDFSLEKLISVMRLSSMEVVLQERQFIIADRWWESRKRFPHGDFYQEVLSNLELEVPWRLRELLLLSPVSTGTIQGYSPQQKLDDEKDGHFKISSVKLYRQLMDCLDSVEKNSRTRK